MPPSPCTRRPWHRIAPSTGSMRLPRAAARARPPEGASWSKATDDLDNHVARDFTPARRVAEFAMPVSCEILSRNRQLHVAGKAPTPANVHGDIGRNLRIRQRGDLSHREIEFTAWVEVQRRPKHPGPRGIAALLRPGRRRVVASRLEPQLLPQRAESACESPRPRNLISAPHLDAVGVPLHFAREHDESAAGREFLGTLVIVVGME